MGASERAMPLLGHPAVVAGALLVSGSRLRIVAYHDVPDPEVFRRHARYLAERYHVVSAAEASRALTCGRRLPPRSVWLTFDDGHPAVFTDALPILAEFQLTASAYVCPSVIDTHEPYWWEIVRSAARQGLTAAIAGREVAADGLEGALKRCPDQVRRSTVARLREREEARAGAPLRRPQATREQLRSWQAAGHELGNHTWDHPCLDRCSDAEQRRQVASAHGWLADEMSGPVISFAYPNGNWAGAAEDELVRLGYRTALGFDHRLAAQPSQPLRASRLRLDSDAATPRLRAVLAGTHPAAMAGRDRAIGRGNDDPRRLPPMRPRTRTP
jgi:peptidoglycan/xylan/chitin deacetylase (PgdA/CDA1 family)